MNTCAHHHRIQDLLDGELAPAEAAELHLHAATCTRCSAEIAAYQRVFHSLGAIPLVEPRPELTERIFARVSPAARTHRRFVRAFGWSYGGAVAACLAGLLLWAIRPSSSVTFANLLGEASRRILGLLVFLLDAYAFAILRVADGWGFLVSAAGRLAPVQRALATLLGHPSIELSLALATLSCVALFWWMRARDPRDRKGIRHVGVLGF